MEKVEKRANYDPELCNRGLLKIPAIKLIVLYFLENALNMNKSVAKDVAIAISLY